MPLDMSTQKKILDLNKNHTIYSTWSDPKLFKTIVEEMASPFSDITFDKVLGIEARGFILGAPIAYILEKGFVVLRKGGKMYNKYYGDDIYSTTFKDYSGKEKSLEIEKNEKSIKSGDRVLIVDDWFETGNQGHSAVKLIEEAGGEVVGISIMINEMSKEVEKSFDKYDLSYLVRKV